MNDLNILDAMKRRLTSVGQMYYSWENRTGKFILTARHMNGVRKSKSITLAVNNG
jgi:hypothetical protein